MHQYATIVHYSLHVALNLLGSVGKWLQTCNAEFRTYHAMGSTGSTLGHATQSALMVHVSVHVSKVMN